MTSKADLYSLDLRGATWTKSTRSTILDEGECVEVSFIDGGAVAVRDSVHPERGDLRFTAGEWAAFTAGVRDGEF